MDPIAASMVLDHMAMVGVLDMQGMAVGTEADMAVDMVAWATGMGMGMGGHGAHGGMGMAAHSRPGMHPASSMVSIAHDPYGMFGYPGNISRMNLAHGRAQFSSKSVPTTCPRCKHDIMTLVRRRPNALNIAASAGAVVAGVIFKLPMAMLPLAMLPLQVKALQPKIHYCPRCNYKLGKNVKVTVPLE
ncbi:hypothetical protein EV183_003992 [Coemansia sp. RSA 2336]|nr:hypothetical protein EV183_003992 [Coemansia sp. RSA 2336]